MSSSLAHIGKKRITALEQLSLLLRSRARPGREEAKTPAKEEAKTPGKEETKSPLTGHSVCAPEAATPGKQKKTEEECIKIIDTLTREMFDYTSTKETEAAVTSTVTRARRGESQYDKVMRQLDHKLQLEASRGDEETQRPGSDLAVTVKHSRQERAGEVRVETIDAVLGPPDKILIRTRYQPHLDTRDEEEGEEREGKLADVRSDPLMQLNYFFHIQKIFFVFVLYFVFILFA